MVIVITTPVFVIMASIVVIVIDVIAVNLQMHRRQNHHDAHIQKITTRAIKQQAKVDLKSQSTIKIKTRQKWRPSVNIKNNDTAIVSAIITTLPIKFITNNMSL
jgi:hypothetical protein